MRRPPAKIVSGNSNLNYCQRNFFECNDLFSVPPIVLINNHNPAQNLQDRNVSFVMDESLIKTAAITSNLVEVSYFLY